MGLACLLGCASVVHPTAQVPAPASPPQTEESSQGSAAEALDPAQASAQEVEYGDARPPEYPRRSKPVYNLRIVPLPDDRLLGASSREERDAILEGLVRFIVAQHPGSHRYGSFEEISRPPSEDHIQYYDPSVQLTHALADLEKEFRPLSDSNGGNCILMSPMTIVSNKATIDLILPNSWSVQGIKDGIHHQYHLSLVEGRWKLGNGVGNSKWVRDFWVE